MCKIQRVTRYFDNNGTVIFHWWDWEEEREKEGFIGRERQLRGKPGGKRESDMWTTHDQKEGIDPFRIRDSEHKKAADTQRWSHSGLTQHMERCKAEIEGPDILYTNDNRNKNPKYQLRIMEALYIRRFNCGPNKGMNEDMGSYVTHNQWQPVFNRMQWVGEGPGIIPSFWSTPINTLKILGGT